MDNTNYNLMFSNYPDVINFKQMKEMLENICSTLKRYTNMVRTF